MNAKTLVFLDLESTGLQDSGRPRICELSLVAVKTKEFLELYFRINNEIESNKSEESMDNILPRIINKLTLFVYPMAPILPHVSRITWITTTSTVKQNLIRAQY